ncbi:hypothetical protein CDD80_1892 [Ophiocordyceps camponoti-rufipedis]|uniref:Uncharacterized protein n=1 Tax=Ophiocordyceps camponoti-rufipedis TaxID=2004952 RepID=A0A2C5ZA06_9HYPO|nr:hypothetical protein CDD80_1892 [Ophiocordyceps camponoti-rufipedis]
MKNSAVLLAALASFTSAASLGQAPYGNSGNNYAAPDPACKDFVNRANKFCNGYRKIKEENKNQGYQQVKVYRRQDQYQQGGQYQDQGNQGDQGGQGGQYDDQQYQGDQQYGGDQQYQGDQQSGGDQQYQGDQYQGDQYQGDQYQGDQITDNDESYGQGAEAFDGQNYTPDNMQSANPVREWLINSAKDYQQRHCPGQGKDVSQLPLEQSGSKFCTALSNANAPGADRCAFYSNYSGKIMSNFCNQGGNSGGGQAGAY